MEVEVTPAVAGTEHRALLAALERMRPAEALPYEEAWRRAGIREATEGDDCDAGYAFSPRRTRGATRA